MWGNLNVPLQKEGNNDEQVELNLELSIGGNYGISRTGVCYNKVDVGQENGNGVLDLNKRKESQALKRQDARKKREDKLFLEAQKFQLRVQDRENREKEDGFVDLGRKGEKFGEDLNLSLFSQSVSSENEVPFEVVYKNENGNDSLSMYCDSGFSNLKIDQGNYGAVSSSNGYLERSSSTVSDCQRTLHKGVSTSDSGCHSNGLNSLQEKNHPITDHLFEQLEGNDSSSHTESRMVCQLSEDSSQTKNKRSTTVDPTSGQTRERNNAAVTMKRPPRPSNQNQVTPPHMPCVSTKGNSPNGKTIMGFLYKYTKSEISIMCVCHGTLFSPAGFVEHAGCVGIENPLRHITVVPSA